MTAGSVEQLGRQQPFPRPEEASGLRERKKVATRQALGEAAIRLAVERGLDNVLVEDIADAAGVSARTFNNYFASKYEAICALQQARALRIGDELRARPPGEPLWESVTQAVLSQFGPADRAPDKDWIARIRLVITTPALVGEYLKVQGMAQYHLAEAIAERAGTSLETDMFPRIMAGAVLGCHAGRDGTLAALRSAGAARAAYPRVVPAVRRGMREVLPAEAADSG